jgi:hypothetical protein
VGPIASGPPASPIDGQIWIATGVGPDSIVWQFRYNAGSSSAYKWEFIGGPPITSSALASVAMAGGWNPYNPQAPAPRAGIYLIGGSATIANVGASATLTAISAAVAGVMGYATTQATFGALAAGQSIGFSFNPAPYTAALGNALALAAYTAIASNMSLAQISILPQRVS